MHFDLMGIGRPPSVARMLVVSALVVAASLGSDVTLVHLATSEWPQLRSYGHFRFSDYGTLTIVGVLPACVAWPLVIRLTAEPRIRFFRLALAATVVLVMPDIWILLRHEPVRAVGTLITMHLVIALVAYNALVHLAPPRRGAWAPGGTVAPRRTAEDLLKFASIALIALDCLEFILGIAVLYLVPFSRPTGWFPQRNQPVYLVHAGIGGILGLGALVVLFLAWQCGRMDRFGALLGLFGIALAAVGGVLADQQQVRSGGMVMMFAGATVAAFGYVITLLGSAPPPVPTSTSTTRGDTTS
jgi:hypothetical protein